MHLSNRRRAECPGPVFRSAFDERGARNPREEAQAQSQIRRTRQTTGKSRLWSCTNSSDGYCDRGEGDHPAARVAQIVYADVAIATSGPARVRSRRKINARAVFLPVESIWPSAGTQGLQTESDFGSGGHLCG